MLAKRQAAIIEGRYELPAPKQSMDFSRFVDEHYADELRGLRTADEEIRRVTTGPLGRHFASAPLAKITTWAVQQYVEERRQRAGAPAINRDLARLSRL